MSLKKISLVPLTLVTYAGNTYGAGMQFDVDPQDAEAFVKSGQAKVVEPEASTVAVEKVEQKHK